MPTESDPIVNNWYQHVDKGQEFEVVDIDKKRGLVEIQYFDGGLDEIDLDYWYDLDIQPIETPEDWTGPVDDIERDDIGYTETDMKADDWSAPVAESPGPQESAEGEEPAADTDEWGETPPPQEESWRREG